MALPFNITPQSLIANSDFILNTLNLGLNVDVVGIYDATTLKQVFADARPIKALVREISRTMDSPLENGSIFSDHHIIMPTMIDMQMLIPASAYSSAYQQIRSAWINATKLSVQTKTGVYFNMIIAELPHEEDPEMYDAISMSLRFKEVILVQPSSIGKPNTPPNYAPADPQNTSTVARGKISRLLVTLPAAILSYVNTVGAWGR